MSKKLLVAGVVMSLVAVMLVGIGAQTASAMTCAEMNSIMTMFAPNATAAQIAQAQVAAGLNCGATASASYTFTRNLTVGSTGADVTALQTKLGVTPATGYFGAITKAAVIVYQTANGITPAAGYVGPITLAKLNYVAPVVVVPPTTPVVTGGDEGELKTFSNLTGLDSSVNEGQEDVKVFGVKFEANDSDMSISRVDVDMTLSGTGSSQLDNYITEASLMINGAKVATMDVNDADEDNDVYTFRFKGIDSVVKEDATAKVYVLVSAVSNIDGDDDAKVISVDIQADGIRAVDGAGISDTYATDSSFTAKTFSVGEEDTADVSISESDEDPDASILIVKDEDDSAEYTVLVFNAESADADSDIQTVTIDVVSASSSVNSLIKDLTLVIDGEEFDGTIDSTTATSTSFSFDVDGDVVMDADEEVEFVVKAVLNQQVGNYSASGESLTFSLATSDLDTEDSATGDNNTETGSATGNTHSLSIVGVSVTVAKISTVTSVDAGNGDYVTHKLTLSIKALEDTVYVPLNATTVASTTAGIVLARIQAWTGTTTVNIIQTSDLDETSESVKISKGQTATIEVTVVNNPTTDGFVGLELDTVRFSESAGGYDLTFTAPDTSAYQTTNSFVPAD